MYAENNQISGRQTARLLLFDLLGYSALLLPSAIAATAKTDGLFSIVLGIAEGLLYLKLLQMTIWRMKGSFCETLTAVFGSVLGNGIKCGYLLHFLLLAGRVAAVFGELVTEQLLQMQFSFVLAVILALVCYGAFGGMEGRARVYELLFWIVLLPFFLMMVLAVPAVDVDYWMPIAFSSPWAVIKGSYQVFLCSSVLCFLPFVTEYVKNKQTVVRCGKKALLWTGSILGILYLILLGMFGADALKTMDYPVVTMMSRIQMTGGFLKRADALMFGVWFFTLYALISSLTFFSGTLWDFGKNGGRIFLFAKIAVIYLLANVFYYSEECRMMYEKFFMYVGTPFVVLVPLLLCCLLSGCSTSRLEQREFPDLLIVSSDAEFGEQWLNCLQEGTKQIDYNHLKVILVEKEFLEEEEKMEEMLGLLKGDKNVPFNAYIVTTEDAEKLTEAKLQVPLGDYLEQLLEQADTVKKETYPTLGMLYQELENQKETLFIPMVSLVGETPEITAYEVYRRSVAIGQTESDVALLSFFINNQIKEYVLQLDEHCYVKLTNPNNQIDFREVREHFGRLKRQVAVRLNCTGERLQKRENHAEITEAWLTEQIKDDMQTKAARALEAGIDVTNSFKKLGMDREWYAYYMQCPEFFESEIEIILEGTIQWVD